MIFLGLTISSSWGNGHATPYRALLRALHRMGVQSVFYEKNVSYYAKHRDFDSCNFCELVLYESWEEVRGEVLQRARHADVVMTASYLPDGAQISEDLLEVDGPLHVFYDMDTPVTLSRLAGQPHDYLRQDLIPRFDLYVSFTGGRILQRLEGEFGARLVRPLYGCVDPEVYRRVEPRAMFACHLSFMGTYSADREQKTRDYLLRSAELLPQQEFLLAGSLYPKEWLWPQNVRRIEHVAPADHPALYSSSRATLNITRKEMAESGFCPSGRFFEAAACGTPLLTDEWDGLENFFDPADELYVVRNTEEVVQALQLPDEQLERRAARARQRTLDQHTGRCRAEELLSFCEEAQQRKYPTMETLA